ncbi:hypothetical protein N431DRAFT_1674 [Stipitochalara longipes BDJ]|nr:hypothetical protein N431DRAFT_1674 [Stipitochalara longipes BDJ]
MDALEYIANLLRQSRMREALYRERYEVANNYQNGHVSHIEYRESLKALYVSILLFEATSVCYLSRKTASRIALDTIKWNNWKTLLASIKSQEEMFSSVNELWKETKYQEECTAANLRHLQQLESMDAVSDEVSRLSGLIHQVQLDDERIKLLGWLSSIDTSKKYTAARATHTPRTCDWLTHDSIDFQRWKGSKNSLLWLHGKAGCGKSVLSSSVIYHIKSLHNSDPYTALAYFYCDFNDISSQKTTNILSSLIRQLCSQRPDTPLAVLNLRQIKDAGQFPELKQLEDTLRETTLEFGDVYIVIDAIDECPEINEDGETPRHELLQSLQRIHGWALPNIHILITSRPEHDIELEMNSFFSDSRTAKAIDLHNQSTDVNNDISTYIDERFASQANFRSWPIDLKLEARSALIKKADNMFQYVVCQFQAFQKLKQASKVRQALDDLPNGLDETYIRMLLSIDLEYHRQVTLVLEWLAFSRRPLSVGELAEAFVTDPEKSPSFGERLFNPEDILEYLPGLVITVALYNNRAHDRIRLAHFSIKEYLVSERIRSSKASHFAIVEQEAHTRIAESCLVYHLQLSEAEITSHETRDKYMLWNYAAKYWAHHLELVDRSSWTERLIIWAVKVLTEKSALLNEVLVSGPLTWDKLDDFGIDDLAPPLYYTTVWNCYKLTSHLLQRGARIDDIGGEYGTALNAAAFFGHTALVQLLLDAKPNVNLRIEGYGTALTTALL